MNVPSLFQFIFACVYIFTSTIYIIHNYNNIQLYLVVLSELINDSFLYL